MTEHLVDLIPEICLLAGAVLTLLTGSFSPRDRQWQARLVALAAIVAALAATGVSIAGRPNRLVYDDGFTLDTATNIARLVVLVSLVLVVGLATDRVRGHPRETEFYVLALTGGLGSILLAGAADLLVLVVAFLLASVPLYALVGWDRDRQGTEATLKYYLIGALSGIVLLLGVTLLFAVGRSTSYLLLPKALANSPHGIVALGVVAVLAGLLFKAGGVPVHFWVPDVAAGATVPAAAYVTTVPKIGALVAAYRLFAGPLHAAPVQWPVLVAVLAVATMTLGNLAAFFQDDPRRMLGYSTISQVGYLLLPVAVAGHAQSASGSLLFYLAGYAITNLGAFAVLAAAPTARTLADFAGLAGRHRWLAVALAVCLLGFVGTPPTAVFFGKLTIFGAAIDGGLTWLVVIAALNTVASVFYYLRWLAPVFQHGDAEPVVPTRWAHATAIAAAVGTIALGIAGWSQPFG